MGPCREFCFRRDEKCRVFAYLFTSIPLFLFMCFVMSVGIYCDVTSVDGIVVNITATKTTSGYCMSLL